MNAKMPKANNTSATGSKPVLRQSVPERLNLAIDQIVVPKSARACDKDTVAALADSISLIGLQNPLAVRRDGRKFILVSGGHRRAALNALGINETSVLVIDDQNARIWNISENLHRLELTRLERDDAIVEYRQERSKRKRNAVNDKRGGVQPHDLGHSQAARELGIDRKQVRAAVAHSGISVEAKTALKLNGLDNSAEALDKVAKCKSPRDQVRCVHRLAAAIQEGNCKKTCELKKRPNDLASKWRRSDFRPHFEKASLLAKRNFVSGVLIKVDRFG